MGEHPGPSLGGRRPWRGVLLAVVGLLAAMALVGSLGIAINRGLADQVNDALQYDVELEDAADDLRVAVLNLRQYHRDLLFSGPSRARVRAWDERYEALIDEIDAMADLGVREPTAPQPDAMRRVAEDYEVAFRSAIRSFEDDPRLFEAAGLEGLEQIERLADSATQLDRLGEELAARTLVEVQQAGENASLVLLTVMAGLVAVGALLGLFVLRLVEATRQLADRESEAAAALAELSRAKTDFIADVSHELRTPLTVVRGNAEVGLKVRDDPEHGELLREIADEATRMTKMVEDLLFLARSDSTGVPVELTDQSVATWMADLNGRATNLARERGAELEVDLDGEGRVLLDGERLSQAVLALVDNAAKHAPGSPIALFGGPEHGGLTIHVADRGPGIPKPELPHVFERYRRGRRSSGSSGSGLGLAIARTIVEGHGGTIAVNARTGGGTVVTLTIPLADDSPASGEEGTWRARPDSNRRSPA